MPVVTMYKEASRDVSKSSKDTFKAEQTSIVYDADGNEIKKLKQEKDVSYLDYEDIPDAAKLAIISIEDKNLRHTMELISKVWLVPDFSCLKSGKYYDGWKHDHTAACKKYLSWI